MKQLLVIFILSLSALSACQQVETDSELQENQTVESNQLAEDAENNFHESLLTIDSHVDISREFMRHMAFAPGLDTNMKVDFNKMRKGGLDAAFFIVYVAQKTRDEAGYKAAYKAAIKKFTGIRKMTDGLYSDQIGLALTADDVEAINKEGKLVAIIGVENGFPLAKNIERVDEFYQRGARYIGLTHSGHNDICDSSYAKKSIGDLPEEHKGISEFGKQVIERMNQIGMMIDVSHASDKCVEDVLSISKAPIIASHSGTRALQDHNRNLPDHLIKAIANKGGVIQLVGYSGFINIDPVRAAAYKKLKSEIAKIYGAEEFDYKYHEYTPEYFEGIKKVNKAHPLASVSQFVDQIEHAIKVAGIDHVGVSSDFDGGGELDDWRDASETPNITKELLKRGYAKEEIQKIWSGNLLRVWRSIEQSKTL